LTNVRERVHQPFRDTVIRASGYVGGTVQDTTKLFTVAGKPEGETNLPQGSVLPSDQSMVVLALRAFTWFRASIQRSDAVNQIVLPDGTAILAENGDWVFPTAAGSPAFAAALAGNAVGDNNDVYRLHWQAEEQLLWSYGAGDKFSIIAKGNLIALCLEFNQIVFVDFQQSWRRELRLTTACSPPSNKILINLKVYEIKV